MARMTVKTLAAALGVSPATISNAYNRPDQLSPQLRERILATAAELGYPGPDAAGRILWSGMHIEERDLSRLDPGTYVVRIIKAGAARAIKVIKQVA